MTLTNLLVVGAGGHGRVVADAAEAAGYWRRIAFIDDRIAVGQTSGRWSVVGNQDDLANMRQDFEFAVIGIGRAKTRLALIDRLSMLGYRIATIVHPRATVAPDVVIEYGSVVFAGAVINVGTQVGRGCIINTNASVDHDCYLGEGVHICPGAQLAGGVRVGTLGWIGIGASVIQQAILEDNVTVGAGAVVVDDLPAGVTAVGLPARPIEK